MTKNTMRKQFTLLGAALTLLLAFGVAQAQNTYTVTTTGDVVVGCTGTAPSFNCSTLRDAVAAANADTVGNTISATDTINFNIPSGATGCVGTACTITLGSTLPAIHFKLTLTIDGSAQSITLRGNNAVQLMSNSGNLTVNALTFADGSCTGTFCGGGGAIRSSTGGSLTVTNSTFSGNSAPSRLGGAIVSSSSLTVTNSTFSGNSSGTGGAIYEQNAVANSLTVTNSTFSGNTAGTAGLGGAIATGVSATLYNTILAGGGTNGNCGTTGGLVALTDGGGT